MAARQVVMVASLLAAAAPCWPRDVPARELAQAKQCMQCHEDARDTIGPSFATIRAIYRGMDRPVPALVAVIRKGSDANLGPLRGHARMPDMSERPAVSEAEARRLASWILRGGTR